MARALFGAGLTGMSGSINKQNGGFTFTKKGIVRVRVSPTNPQTASQQQMRALFAFLTTSWAALPTADKEAWETARNSDAYYLKTDSVTGVQRKFGSAKDLYIAMNTNHQVAGTFPAITNVAPLSEPVASVGTDDISVTSVVIDASAESFTLTYTGTYLNELAIIKATPPVSAGNLRSTSVKSKMRVFFGGDPGASPANLGTSYTAVHGALTGATGKKIFWEVHNVDLATGKLRLVASGNTIVVA